MHINDLPTDCLILIFNRIPWINLIELREVCSQWLAVIELEIFSRKRSLKLFAHRVNLKTYCLQSICDNALESERLRDGFGSSNDNFERADELILMRRPDKFGDDCDDEENDYPLYELLAKLFPQIENLVVFFDVDCTRPNLPFFLTRCKNLKSLRLCGSVLVGNAEYAALLCEAIDQLPVTLVELELMVNNLFVAPISSKEEDEDSSEDESINYDKDHDDENNNFSIFQQQVDSVSKERWLPIELTRTLSNVKRFSLCEYGGDPLRRVIQSIGTNCSHLRFDCVTEANVSIPQAIEANSALSRNVTHLRLCLGAASNVRALLSFACEHFPILQHLDVQCFALLNNSMIIFDAQLIAELAQLKHLTEIRLSHIGIDMEQFASLNHQMVTLPSLPSIRTLHLSQTTTFPNHLPLPFIYTTTDERCWQAIAAIFPNLSQINVRIRRDSIQEIVAHLKKYFPKTIEANVYSVGDVVAHFLGRHLEECYFAIPPKMFRVFQSNVELYFDFIKDT